MKDPEDESEILEQKFSQMHFGTEEDMKLWSPVPGISTDDAISSLEGTF